MHLGRFTMTMCQHLKNFQKKDDSVTIHVRNLRMLATELYKTKENLAAPIMEEYPI